MNLVNDLINSSHQDVIGSVIKKLNTNSKATVIALAISSRDTKTLKFVLDAIDKHSQTKAVKITSGSSLGIDVCSPIGWAIETENYAAFKIIKARMKKDYNPLVPMGRTKGLLYAAAHLQRASKSNFDYGERHKKDALKIFKEVFNDANGCSLYNETKVELIFQVMLHTNNEILEFLISNPGFLNKDLKSKVKLNRNKSFVLHFTAMGQQYHKLKVLLEWANLLEDDLSDSGMYPPTLIPFLFECPEQHGGFNDQLLEYLLKKTPYQVAEKT